MTEACLPTEQVDPSAIQSARRSLRSNFSWTLLGNLSYAGCQWAMLIALAKLGSTEQVGEFALGLAVTAPIVLFSNLHLRTLQATDASDEYRFAEYFRLRFLTAFLSVAVATVVGFAVYSRETALVIAAIGVAKAIEAVSDVIYGLMQQQERMDRVAQSLMLRGPLSLLLMVMTLFATKSVLLASLAIGFAWLTVLLSFDLKSCRGYWKAGNSLTPAATEPAYARLMRLAKMALPLGFVAMLVSLIPNIPRYFVEHELGAGALGIFAAIAYLLVAGTTVVNALGQSVSSRLAQSYARGTVREFGSLMLRLMLFAIILGLSGLAVALIAGRWLLTMLYTREYASQLIVFRWLMVAAGLSYVASFAWYGITAARAIQIQLPLYSAVALVALIASWWLVPRYQLPGAALALVLAMLVQVIGACGMLWAILRSRRIQERRSVVAQLA